MREASDCSAHLLSPIIFTFRSFDFWPARNFRNSLTSGSTIPPNIAPIVSEIINSYFQFLKELLSEEAILITTEDKHGEDMKGKFGRVLGDFRVGGKTVSQILIEEGHAVAYNGESKDDVQEQHMINRQRLIGEGKVTLEN